MLRKLIQEKRETVQGLSRLGGKRRNRVTIWKMRRRWMDEYIRMHPADGPDDYFALFPIREADWPRAASKRGPAE